MWDLFVGYFCGVGYFCLFVEGFVCRLRDLFTVFWLELFPLSSDPSDPKPKWPTLVRGLKCLFVEGAVC